MNTKKIAQPGLNLPEPDLIDRIANALPAEVRADYYRELRHCRSLPENDEMLRILRAMQFLTLLMVQAPGRVAVERERLEQLFTAALQSLEKLLKSSEAYKRQLDERLSRLPVEIAAGISPQAIAANINESLRQRFVLSTIPETARALAQVAEQMKKSRRNLGPRRAHSEIPIVVRRKKPGARLTACNRPFLGQQSLPGAPRTICQSIFARSTGGRSMRCPASRS